MMPLEWCLPEPMKVIGFTKGRMFTRVGWVNGGFLTRGSFRVKKQQNPVLLF